VTSEPLRQLLLRLHGRVDAHDLDKLRVPDTRAARAAEELAAAGQTQSLTNHGIRSYGFGALLGIGEGRQFDAEVLYIAALIHDIGLMPAFDHGNRFEADGEQAARELLLEVGWPIERADQAAHAIREHWDGPESEDEAETLLLAYGTSVDVGGWRLGDFDETVLAAFLDAAPRCGFKEHFIELVEQRAHDPHLKEVLAGNFVERVRGTPFAE
jgi:hypothetical protein